MKKVIIRILRMLRKGAEVEVWDTSAISTWFDEFLKSINSGKKQVIVPEGVEHELSKGRRNHENCRMAHKYVIENKISKNNPSGKVKVYVTDDKMRAWPIDEQIVGIAAKYYKKGYNVTLVTCDKNQSDKASDRDINVRLLAGNRNQYTNTIKLKPVPERRPAPKPIEQDENKNQLSIPCVSKGNMIYIDVNQRVAVYDSRGRRKIGKDELIPVSVSDSFKYRDKCYQVSSLTKTMLNLKVMDST